MSTLKPNAKAPCITANLARVEGTRAVNQHLSVDILSDLREAFDMFDKDKQDAISISQFKTIIDCFGFQKLSLNEYNQDLKRLDPEFPKRTGVDFEFLKCAVAVRWNKTGLYEEAKDAFRVFDKKDKHYITVRDLKDVFDEYLEISKAELEEIMLECDDNGTGSVSQKEFNSLFLS